MKFNTNPNEAYHLCNDIQPDNKIDDIDELIDDFKYHT
jgi:hypothetical protein